MSVSQAAAEGTQASFTATDGAKMFSRTWEVDHARRRGAVIVTHGYGEHSGRYGAIAQRFNDAGFSVYAYDQRGHGKSPGPRGVISSFSRLPDDLDAFVSHVTPNVEGVPVFYFGHSMGALVLTHYVLLYEPATNGIVLSSGLFKPADDVSPVLKTMAPIISTLLPFIPVHRLPTDGLSRDADVVRAYEADPLVHHGPVNARTGHCLNAAMEAIQRQGEMLHLPALFIHGKADRLAHWEGSHLLHARCGAEDKHLSLYEGAYHEIFNDTDKERFFEEVLAWMNARL